MSRPSLVAIETVNLMKETLHFWVGMPNSPSQLTQLLARLEKAFPPSKGRTQVVFENEVMPISDLAAGFDTGTLATDEVVALASELGVHEAAALIGVRAASILAPAAVDSLTYLGGIEVNDGD